MGILPIYVAKLDIRVPFYRYMSPDTLGHKSHDFLCISDRFRGPRVAPGGLGYFHLGYTKKYRKKPVQFSMGHQMAIYASNFKKLGSFDIGKVWPIRILGDFRRFWAISGDFRKKTKNRPRFFLRNLPKITLNRRFSSIWRRIRICLTLLISKLTEFWIFGNFWWFFGLFFLKFGQKIDPLCIGMYVTFIYHKKHRFVQKLCAVCSEDMLWWSGIQNSRYVVV